PDWMSRSCLSRYFSPIPARLGKLGAELTPWGPWQAAQAAALASPAAASPAAAGVCAKPSEIRADRHSKTFLVIFSFARIGYNGGPRDSGRAGLYTNPRGLLGEAPAAIHPNCSRSGGRRAPHGEMGNGRFRRGTQGEPGPAGERGGTR